MTSKPKTKTAPKTDVCLVECIVSNVWTSKGKILKGETVVVPNDEAKALVENKQYKKG